MIQSFVQPKTNALVLLWPCLALTAVQKQPNLTFHTHFFYAVNHWVVLPKKPTESVYLYGYIYFDPKKGIQFHLENTLEFNGSWNLNRSKKSYVLQKSLHDPNLKVALIPKAIQRQWNLPEKPEAIAAELLCQTAENRAALGHYFNQIEQSSLAVPVLKKALKIYPNNPQLLFELGYAYNAMARYTKAIRFLEIRAQIAPSQKCWQELGYAYLQTKKPTQAEYCYFEAIKCCQNKSEIQKMGWEMQAVFQKMGEISLAKTWEMMAKTGVIPDK
jgi:tetratricopeptide (TPR) repeat protein